MGKKAKAKAAKRKAEPEDPNPVLADIRPREEWAQADVRRRLSAEFVNAKPFPHVVLHNFLGLEGLQAVREDIQKVDATEKETDLFRFFQTGDLAPREPGKASPNSSAKRRKAAASPTSRAPALAALTKVFASCEFRQLLQEITQCGELSERVDLSAQVYPKGSHLLCHDDVIGTRKVSFIYYLTDPSEEWTATEGGALELYPPQPGAAQGTPAAVPAKELLPQADTLAMFLVEPGVSFHAVREVRGSRARVSLQGWLHAPSLEQTLGFDKRGLATLQQILETRSLNEGQGEVAASKAPEETAGDLSEDDLKALSQWLAPAYLKREQLEAVSKQFEETSYAMLTEFLRPDVAHRLSRELEEVDAEDGFGPDAEEVIPCYRAGVQSGWELLGPPHLRRYLRYQALGGGQEEDKPTNHARLGASLQDVAAGLFSSSAFRRWLKACTGLEPKDAGHPEVRRFRPGLDYTVAAARGAMSRTAGEEPQQDAEGADLDAILVFARGDGSAALGEGSSSSSAADGSAATASSASPEAAASERWASEEVGGFESYLAADDDEETAEAQEVYRGADTDGPLVNLPAVPNALCLVMRDSKTLRFLKYLSRDAPSSRVDISASYAVDAPEGSSAEEDAGE